MHETDQYICDLAEIVYQGRWMTEKQYNLICDQVSLWSWHKKGLVLESLKTEIDNQRPWKVKKGNGISIDDALRIKDEDDKPPF